MTFECLLKRWADFHDRSVQDGQASENLPELKCGAPGSEAMPNSTGLTSFSRLMWRVWADLE